MSKKLIQLQLLVISCLSKDKNMNPKGYKWRSINSICKQTGLCPKKVILILALNKNSLQMRFTNDILMVAKSE